MAGNDLFAPAGDVGLLVRIKNAPSLVAICVGLDWRCGAGIWSDIRARVSCNAIDMGRGCGFGGCDDREHCAQKKVHHREFEAVAGSILGDTMAPVPMWFRTELGTQAALRLRGNWARKSLVRGNRLNP